MLDCVEINNCHVQDKQSNFTLRPPVCAFWLLLILPSKQDKVGISKAFLFLAITSVALSCLQYNCSVNMNVRYEFTCRSGNGMHSYYFVLNTVSCHIFSPQ